MLYTKDITVLSISELTKSIKSVLELQYRFVHVHGEVSNLRTPYSGHMYFTLKDNDSQIKAVLFKGQRRYLADEIKEGQKIICHGRLSVYEPRGEYQIIIDTVDHKGTGDLYIQYERLKRQLADEGLFSKDLKKDIPVYPERIVLVTSPTGAAVFDFLKISSQRKFYGDITIFPVTVQGDKSANEIADSLDIINTSLKADLIILIRGGGSLEDLWAFNEEKVARAISRSQIPVATGIGHETDNTIADLCADLQTHTPTAAAEAILPDCQKLREHVKSHERFLISSILQRIAGKEEFIRQSRRIIGDLDLYLSNHNLKLDFQIAELLNAMQRRLLNNAKKIQMLRDKLQTQAPLTKISMDQQKINYLSSDIRQRILNLLEKKKGLLGKQAAVMESVSPLSILARGYSIVSRKDRETGVKEIITSSEQVAVGDFVDVRLSTGELTCQVDSKKFEN